MNRHYKSRICIDCGAAYIPTSNRQLRCKECKREKNKQVCRAYHAKTYIRKGYNQKGAMNNAWKGGVATYRNMIPKDKCELCGAIEGLLIHHKDHNRRNNDVSNLQVLCKRCHQEHHCIRDKYGRYTKHS